MYANAKRPRDRDAVVRTVLTVLSRMTTMAVLCRLDFAIILGASRSASGYLHQLDSLAI